VYIKARLGHDADHSIDLHGPRPWPECWAWEHRKCSGLDLVEMIAIKCYIEHFGLSHAIIFFFGKEKVIRGYVQLTLVKQSGSVNKSH
jgi:hypothetical protein